MKPENEKRCPVERRFSITNMNGQSEQEYYSYLNENGITESPRKFSITDMNGKAGTDTRYSLLCMNGL